MRSLPSNVDVIQQRSGHITPLEWRFARNLDVRPQDIEGPPCALLVGEAPGANGHGRGSLAMFPWPPTSAAGRLLKMSGMPPGVYLGRFLRRNLMEELPDKWRSDDAREAAYQLRRFAIDSGLKRIVLLGVRVRDAFMMDAFFVRRDVYSVELPDERFTADDPHGVVSLSIVAIPHPSGLNHLYHDPNIREAARHELMWAAGLA